MYSDTFVSPKLWLAKVFDLSRGRGKRDEYKYRVIFVLYEAELDNKFIYSYLFDAPWVRLSAQHNNNY